MRVKKSITLLLAFSVASCSSDERTEPARDDLSCSAIRLLCQREPSIAPITDATSVLWPFCAGIAPPDFSPELYRPGVAQVWYEYDASGAVDLVEVDCQVSGELNRLRPTRDETNRVTGWLDESTGRRTTYTFADDGSIAGAETEAIGPARERLTREFTYAASQWTGFRYEFWYGTTSAGSVTFELQHGTDALDINAAAANGCIDRSTFDHAGDLVTGYAFTSSCNPEIDTTVEYTWSAGHLTESISRRPSDAFEQHTRYTYDGDSLVHVEADVDGDPYITIWFDYDEQQRLTHLTYWGHPIE